MKLDRFFRNHIALIIFWVMSVFMGVIIAMTSGPFFGPGGFNWKATLVWVGMCLMFVAGRLAEYLETYFKEKYEADPNP